MARLPAMGTCDQVRTACRAIAEDARFVTIDLDALQAVAPGEPPALDPSIHYLDGNEADVAAYIIVLDALNFGSGWFPELPGLGYETVARALRERWSAHGPWTATQLRAVSADEVGELLDQPREHELIVLYAAALRELGAWLDQRTCLDVVRDADGSAERLAATLAAGLPMWRDPGFLKRAQIAASDLALAEVTQFNDLAALTVFADNVLPHVLRIDGVLQLSPDLSALIDAGTLLAPGPQERELRACAVRACELLAPRLGLTERDLDNVLWTRGQHPRYSDPPPHRCRTTAY